MHRQSLKMVYVGLRDCYYSGYKMVSLPMGPTLGVLELILHNRLLFSLILC